MKKLLVLSSLLLSTYSAHATVVAEDTAEHTINFTFGRPTADTFLCYLQITGSSLDTMTLPNGDILVGDGTGAGNIRTFDSSTAPLTSTVHFGSANYGASIDMRFCHDIHIPAENPGGMVDSLYKFTTPTSWTYFSHAMPMANVTGYCPSYGIFEPATFAPNFYLGTNTNSGYDYDNGGHVPFPAGTAVDSDAQNCYTAFHLFETAIGPRPAGEASANVTISNWDQVNFN